MVNFSRGLRPLDPHKGRPPLDSDCCSLDALRALRSQVTNFGEMASGHCTPQKYRAGASPVFYSFEQAKMAMKMKFS